MKYIRKPLEYEIVPFTQDNLIEVTTALEGKYELLLGIDEGSLVLTLRELDSVHSIEVYEGQTIGLCMTLGTVEVIDEVALEYEYQPVE